MTKLLLIVAMFTLLPSAVVYAQPAVLGNYTSTDLGGSILIGHFSESWQDGDGEGEVGNTINMGSWNKKQLGTQWRLWCATIAGPPLLTEDTVDSEGNGCRTWVTTYFGGFFWLSGDGPWGGGDGEYNGLIDTYTRTMRICYAKNQEVKTTCAIAVTGRLADYPFICITFDADCDVIDDTKKKKRVDDGYPPFIDGSCSESGQYGWWGIVHNIRLSLTGCTTPVEQSTWGAIKSRYRN